MIVYPAIDLKDGACVQLVQGRMEDATVYGHDPVAMACQWADMGAPWLHVVDLNGAFEGRSKNLDAIRAIVNAVDIPVQLGGGIRNMEQIRVLIDQIGVARIILGTAALEDPALMEQAAFHYPVNVAVAVDVRNGGVAVRGWAKNTNTTAMEVAQRAKDFGVRTLIYTDITRDGTMSGPNFDTSRKLITDMRMDVILSGGISTLVDVAQARRIGAAGCIIGTALYNGAIDLRQAIDEAEKC